MRPEPRVRGMRPEPRVAVVGAGVVGLCTALSIQEEIPGCKVTVIADKFGADTTSDGAAGIFRPVADHIPGVPVETIRKWSLESWDYYSKIASSPEASDAGMSVVSGYHVSFDTVEKEKVFKDIVYSYKPCGERELSQFKNVSSKRIVANGGKFVKRKIHFLREMASDFDVIVNCAGLESRSLIKDNSVMPVRGQIIRVKAPWIKHVFWTDRGCFVFPCKENVVIGGTKERDDETLESREATREQLWKQACKHIPSLEKAEFIKDWVGLRPLRSPIRVELEEETRDGVTNQIIHNYGHGSYGVALGWGTAREAAGLVKSAIEKRSSIELRNIKAKL